jgi:hypothetical protein
MKQLHASHRGWFGKAALVALVVLLAAPAWAALEERMTFSSDRLSVRSLIGEVRVEAGSGSDFEVLVTIAGKDAQEGLVKLDASDSRLDIRFPAGQHEFVYPKIEGGSNIKLGDGTERIRVRGSGPGMELWADVTVRVPRGTELEVEHGVGMIAVEGVDAALKLSTRSGDVDVENSSGELAVATGSGDVELVRVQGTPLKIATGSGDVEAKDCDGDRLQIATGSGDIELANLRGGSMEVATGSGDVEAQAIEADELDIGTGSGDVGLELDRVSIGKFNVGTGSGDVTLSLPSDASADVHAETHRGQIEVALGDVQYRHREDDEIEFTVGGGGASVDLGTGSGDIRIRN